MLHDSKNRIITGGRLDQADRAYIMLHGRGGSASDMLSFFSPILPEKAHAIAPQATNNTWYPLSFLSPLKLNEPWLSSALDVLKSSVSELAENGISTEKISLIGFSQGACLSLEFLARNSARFHSVIAMSGALIGVDDASSLYKNGLQKTPIFISCSEQDPHIPLERINQSLPVLADLGGEVETMIYPGGSHTITQPELDRALKLLSV